MIVINSGTVLVVYDGDDGYLKMIIVISMMMVFTTMMPRQENCGRSLGSQTTKANARNCSGTAPIALLMLLMMLIMMLMMMVVTMVMIMIMIMTMRMMVKFKEH